MIGSRLKEERERLGVTQPLFAEAADAKKRTLIDWEKGVSSPTALQLSSLATVGVDVLYVVTGQRSQSIPAQAALPREQQLLLNCYAVCNAAAKKHLLQTAAFLASGSKPGESNSTIVRVSGEGNVAAGRDVVQQAKTPAKKAKTV